MSLTESMMCHLLESFNFQFAKPFPVITYREAMNKVSIEFFSLSCCFISLFFLFSTPPTFFSVHTVCLFFSTYLLLSCLFSPFFLPLPLCYFFYHSLSSFHLYTLFFLSLCHHHHLHYFILTIQYGSDKPDTRLGMKVSILFAAVHNTTLLVIFDTEFIFATYLCGMIVNLVCLSIILYVQLIKWLGLLQFFY